MGFVITPPTDRQAYEIFEEYMRKSMEQAAINMRDSLDAELMEDLRRASEEKKMIEKQLIADSAAARLVMLKARRVGMSTYVQNRREFFKSAKRC